MPRVRDVQLSPPRERGTAGGLAYALWVPTGRPRAAVVILHGAGSAQESHFDFAHLLRAAGFAALTFDQRGHGQSDGPLDGRALEDIAAMASLLRRRAGDSGVPLALRGSSMGGYLALLAAGPLGAGAVVAVCPASPAALRRGLVSGEYAFEADVPAVDRFLAAHGLREALGELTAPVLFLHAEGDERVPVEHSRELVRLARHPASRLVTTPGGHHRSVQHDGELQALSVRFLERALPG